MTVISLEVWQPTDGHASELDALLEAARRIHERLGARVTTWRQVAGPAPPGCVVYSTEFDDLTDYGTWMDRLRADDEWRTLHLQLRDDDRSVASRISSIVVTEAV
jgi:hypothetical protein